MHSSLRRRKALRLTPGWFAAFGATACLVAIIGAASVDGADAREALSEADVQGVVRAAARSVPGEQLAVVVVDRRGEPLAVWHRAGATDREDERALALARTGAFFGHNQAPLTSRTVRFISGIHFPPGVRNQPPGPLYGIENTNRVSRQVDWLPDQEYPDPVALDGSPSLGIRTGKTDLDDPDPRSVDPGGMPLYKNGDQVGGIGVAGIAPEAAELAAASGSGTFGGPPPYPGAGFKLPSQQSIYVEGIALPLVQRANLRGGAPGSFPGTGAFRVAPQAGVPAPEGWLVGPAASPEITAAEAERIIEQSIASASRTRAAIRLPIGSRCRMVMAVGDLEGNILALYRMPDATVFSIDVAVAKARNVVYFSSKDREPDELPGLPVGTAVTNRTIGFGAQPLFPAGISTTNPGPFFDLFLFDTRHPGTQGADSRPGPKNGIVFFPGSLPLYRGSKLIGGLGISGDGVEQDDYVAFQGANGFRPPDSLTADHFKVRGVRLPFLKFPRNPRK
jgi:uncharacterized protein GlcG (DUF336 family)